MNFHFYKIYMIEISKYYGAETNTKIKHYTFYYNARRIKSRNNNHGSVTGTNITVD